MSSASRYSHSPALTVATAVAASTLAALPSLLLGALAALVRSELTFDAFELGIAVAVFFVVSGFLSVPAGLVTQVLGPRRALLLGGSATCISMLGLATATWSWLSLLPWMALGGLGHTVTQVSANYLLAVRVQTDRQGMAYGVKQASIPLAGVLAGLAIPTIGVTAGWRSAFGFASLFLIPVVALVLRLEPVPRLAALPSRVGDAPIRAILVISMGAGLGTASASALIVFTVESTMATGVGPSAAGVLLTVGSAAGLTVRVVAGWVADRLQHGSLLFATLLLGAGGLGYLGLAAGGPHWFIAFATLVAFSGGWGFPGLVLLAVVRSSRRAPATALSVARVGPSMGAIIGPAAFGALVEGSGYAAAWFVSAEAALVGAALITYAQRLVRPH